LWAVHLLAPIDTSFGVRRSVYQAGLLAFVIGA
jgi:hypothetical protein